MHKSSGSFKLFIGKRTDRNYSRRMLADFPGPGSLPGGDCDRNPGGRGSGHRGSRWRHARDARRRAAAAAAPRPVTPAGAASRRASPSTSLPRLGFPSTRDLRGPVSGSRLERTRSSQCRGGLHCFGVSMTGRLLSTLPWISRIPAEPGTSTIDHRSRAHSCRGFPHLDKAPLWRCSGCRFGLGSALQSSSSSIDSSRGRTLPKTSVVEQRERLAPSPRKQCAPGGDCGRASVAR
jgi:hypothetical protein